MVGKGETDRSVILEKKSSERDQWQYQDEEEEWTRQRRARREGMRM
jgi:hypothetical protein